LRCAAWACCTLVGVALAAPAAQASLLDDVAQLTQRWSATARVQRIVPRLLSHGERIPIVLPPFAEEADDAGCSSLAVMGSVSTSFVVLRTALVRGSLVGDSVPSVAGAVELVRCGRQRSQLANLWVEMRSPRGVVEFVVAHSPGRLTSLRQELPHRDPGPAWPEGEAGPRPVSPPLKARVGEWEAEAKRDGALAADNRILRADESARVGVDLSLEEGCHRLAGLGLSPARQEQSLDIDLVLYRDSPRTILREDQSENPDASVSLCVAQETDVILDVLGAPPGEPVALLHARFPLPEGLPLRWGPVARERLAEALWDQHFAGVADPPIYESLGVTGMTVLPLQIEPNTCYVVSAGILRGLVKAFQLRLITAGGQASASASNERTSAAVAFCSGVEQGAQLQVEAFGASLAWLAAVWRAEPARAKPSGP
jgi:hypothetical protein